MKLAHILAAAAITVSIHETASAEILDFNSVPLDPTGQYVASTYVEGSVSITRLAGPIVIEGGTFSAPNGTTALVGYRFGTTEDYGLQGNQWAATFASTLNSVSIDLGDFGVDPDTIFLTAFNSSNLQIGTVSQDLAPGFNGMVTLKLTITDIKSIRFGLLAGDEIYADNLVFSPVPIPAVLPIFAAAVGLLGFLSWRRRRHSVVSI